MSSDEIRALQRDISNLRRDLYLLGGLPFDLTTPPTDGQTITWDATNSVWQPSSPTTGSTIVTVYDADAINTNSASMVDMTDMSITVTLAVASNVSVMLLGDDPGAGVDGTMRVIYGASTQVGADHHIDAGSARVMHVYVAGLAAGTYTFKAQWLTSNPSSTTNMVNRTMTVIATPA